MGFVLNTKTNKYMKQLFVVYRNNDLFSTYIPELLALVPKGVEIEKLIFPHGTPVSEMVQPLKELLNKVSAPSLYLSDSTCAPWSELGNEIGRDAFNKAESLGMKRLKCLDDAMLKCVENIFKVTSFEDLLKRISYLVAPEAKVICVVKQSLTDHLYGFLNYKDYKRDEFPGKLNGFLKKIYPLAQIIEVETADEAMQRVGNNSDAMIIVDRHTSILKSCWSIETWEHNAKMLMLPFENAVSHLVGTGKWGEPISAEEIWNECIGSNTFE